MKEHELYINSFWSAIQKLMRLSGEKNCRKGRRRSGVRAMLLLALTVFQNFNFSLTALKNIRTYFLLVLMFHMFSLSAQTPIKDSGADGKTKVIPLVVGQKVPDDFWTIEHLIYVDGDTIRKNLSEYKGKPLILDFWATWCGACLHNFKKLEELKKQHGNELAVLLVNPRKYRDNYEKIHRVFSQALPQLGVKQLSSILYDDYIMELFPHLGIPHYVWINARGRFTAFTDTGGLESNSVRYQIMNPY
ncbi:hypothetical protein KO02_01525 [Sphingobacterium sp. ML3W]|uniref:TlpA family protein disulfide reductase n=1 Tax=Sphingobacterium sp. ML3W TaxID=1538644 RepID=UPI0004F768A4|nr:TlpA disulfide reductase family protein [Sphingobacterium sp. ML3W]AIM35485.1 hypothetical protein KO02_01525 [Sphingobacterium sp. ML3W]